LPVHCVVASYSARGVVHEGKVRNHFGNHVHGNIDVVGGGMLGDLRNVQSVFGGVEEMTLFVVSGFGDDGAVPAQGGRFDDALERREAPLQRRQRQEVFHHVHRSHNS